MSAEFGNPPIMPLDVIADLWVRTPEITAEDWQPTPKPVPPELTADFDSATYGDPPETPGERMAGVPIEQRLDEVMRAKLHDMFGVI